MCQPHQELELLVATCRVGSLSFCDLGYLCTRICQMTHWIRLEPIAEVLLAMLFRQE